MDERREPFLPTLFYIPSEDTINKELKELGDEDNDWPKLAQHRREIELELKAERERRLAEGGQDLWQIWFPGVHINIGGGSDKDSYDGEGRSHQRMFQHTDCEGLSNLAYVWMLQMLGPYLAFEKWVRGLFFRISRLTNADLGPLGSWWLFTTSRL